MKANFDSPLYGKGYRFEWTVGSIAIWILSGLATWFDWLPSWVPIILVPVLIINLLGRHIKGDL